MKSMKKKSKRKLIEPRSVIHIKLSSADKKALGKIASQYAEGNVSAWLRHAGRKYTPKKGEKILLKVA